MNKKIRIKSLEELINQPREVKFDTYEFDELSYTCLLCDIRMIILENKKQKEVIDKAIKYIDDNSWYYNDEDSGAMFCLEEEKAETFCNDLLKILKEVE